MLNAELTAMANEVAGLDSEEKRKIAARQFYIVTLAYEISAAIQGGTGGRTISDQDVALILRALRQGTLATPETQRAVIQEAAKMLSSMYAHADYASTTDEKKRAAYNIWSGMAIVTNERPPQFNDVNAVATRLSSATQGSLSDAFKADVLFAANVGRDPTNRYTDIDQIPQDERKRIEQGLRQ